MDIKKAGSACSARSNSTGWRRSCSRFRQHADRRLRAYPALDDLSAVGLGHGDTEQALGFLQRFGSVTVLNGHIHQVDAKSRRQHTFHTAMSTAFPQPAPGTAPKPGPMKVPAADVPVLGITDVNYVEGTHTLAVVDRTLA